MSCKDTRVRIQVVMAILLVVGCRGARDVREPEYFDLQQQFDQVQFDPDPVEQAMSPVVAELGGPHAVEDYIRAGLAQNPQIQAARLRVQALGNRVPQAASLPDPTLSATVYAEPVQTAAGQQELALSASQKVPWRGKLSARAQMAQQQVEVARAELAAVELEVIEKIKRAYYELYYAQQALLITGQNKAQLELIERIVDQRYRVERKVSQQDQLRVQVEIMRLDTELVQFRQQMTSAQANLARYLHVSPETPLLALDELPLEQLPGDIQSLYQRAIELRPELHAALSTIQRDEHAVDLARLQYLPDVTFGMSWIDTSSAGISPVANGRDAWLLSASMNLPVYRKRLEAGVREAETQVVASARQYDWLKDKTLGEVKDLFAQVSANAEMLRLFREEMIPKAEQALEQSIRAYPLGQVDILQLIDNWRQLLRFSVAEKRLQAQLRQSLASLARAIGSYEIEMSSAEPIPAGEMR